MIINQGWKSKFFLRFPSLWDLDFCGLALRCGWNWPMRGRTGDQRTNQRPGETEAPDSLLGLLSVNLRVLGPVSGRHRTRTDEAALIVPVICQKGENSWLFSFLTFLSSGDVKVHFYARKHNSLTMNEYLFFRPPPFRQERIIFSIMRPGARRHSIAVGFSSSSGSGFGNWHEFSQITLQRNFTHITPGQAEEGGRVWPIALTTSQKHSLKEI